LERLLGETRNPKGRFEERGLAMIVTARRAYFSPVFGSGSGSEISPAAIGKHFNALADRVLAAKDEDGEFREIAFFHTHAGRGTPLSPPDAAALREIAGQFELGDGQRIRIYAVPIEDGGDVLFRKTVFPES
jgi:hypothetical protein